MIVVSEAKQFIDTLPDKSVNCIITSPPYYYQRDYGFPEQIGLEDTVTEYISKLVGVFRACFRVLRDDGTLWINIGDTYGTGTTAPRKAGKRGISAKTQLAQDTVRRVGGKAKNLFGVPFRLALALQDDGWILRSDIIWHKTTPEPETVNDRPTRAHEYIFLFSKCQRYYYDKTAIAEPTSNGKGTKNRRSVWTVGTEKIKHAHIAPFPRKLIEPMVVAGCPVGGVVLDPFIGKGTTAYVAHALKRTCIGCDIDANAVAYALNSVLS